MRRLIIEILSTRVSPETGLVVCTHPELETVLVYFSTGELKFFIPDLGVYKNWEEAEEATQMKWYSFIVDNEQLIASYLRENVIEFDDEFLEKQNAQEIKGTDGTVVGRIVEVPTTEGEHTQTSLVFYSPDLTFTTLTMWSTAEENSRELAGEDLKRIAEELMKYYNTHFRDETETEQN